MKDWGGAKSRLERIIKGKNERKKDRAFESPVLSWYPAT